MYRTIFLWIPLCMVLLASCTQSQYDKVALAKKFNGTDSTIQELATETETELTRHVDDTIYSSRIHLILESARFRLDSLRHSIHKYNKETFQMVDSRLERIIYQTEQELLELKEFAGRRSKSLYDDFAEELEDS